MNKLWTQEEISILKNKYGKITAKQIITFLPRRTSVAIDLKAREIGLKANPSLTRRITNLDLDFFSTPNPLNSYWAGFIAADGNIKKGKNLVRIKLGEKDKGHLHQLVEDCKYSGKVKEAVKNKTSFAPYKKAFVLEIHSKQWVIDLYKNYNITPAKSKTLMPPNNLNHENTIAFICGIIDGDGCIYKTKGWRGSTTISCHVVGTRHLLEWISGTINIVSPSHKKYHHHCSKVILNKNGFYTYCFSGGRLETFFSIVKNMNLPLLQRKWSKL